MVYQLFRDIKKPHNSVLYDILTASGIPMKPVTLITMHLNETCGKLGDALAQLFSQLCLRYNMRKVQENQVRLKLNGTHQLLVCAH
jgi:hypothetical protein